MLLTFGPPELAPFLGKWIRDEISASRKVANLTFGKETLKKLYACGSYAQLQRCLAEDPELAEKYKRRLDASGGESSFIVGPREITSDRASPDGVNRTTRYPVLGLHKEGRTTVVTSTYRGGPMGLELRMRKEWLLVSERYFGRAATLFPRSPVFRYYRAPNARTKETT
ncbi:MAG: hypothetical protein ABSF08_00010 [Candidatus Cybelea sp.]